MPNHNTFHIKPIRELIARHITAGIWLDPFSRNSPFAKQCTTNDLNPEVEADYHLEALDFLRKFEDASVDGVLFDPPYSPRQISECYKQVGKAVHMKDTQASFYGGRRQVALFRYSFYSGLRRDADCSTDLRPLESRLQ